MIAHHAVGVGRLLDMLDEPPQRGRRVAPPGLRGPGRHPLVGGRVEEGLRLAIARIEGDQVVGMLLVPPAGRRQVEAREEIGVRIGIEQHLHALLEA